MQETEHRTLAGETIAKPEDQSNFRHGLERFMTAQFQWPQFTGIFQGKISWSHPDSKMYSFFENIYFNLQLLWLKYIILYIFHITQFLRLARKIKKYIHITITRFLSWHN